MDHIPLLDEVTHVVVHRGSRGDGFLHGAAVVHHAGTWYASWGSSPVDENSLLERECGRRGDVRGGARRWGPVEVIGPNLDGAEARSHGVFHVQDGVLWSLVPRFGRPRDAADAASTFPGLVTDAFRLDPDSGRWELHAEAVAHDFWPMDAPTRLPDGRWIMGGLSGRQNAVVATSGRAPLAWERVEIPRPAGCDMQFAETSVLVWPGTGDCSAIIRYRAGSLPGLPEQVALVSTSSDAGRTWAPLAASNLPLTASKPYAGHLPPARRSWSATSGPTATPWCWRSPRPASAPSAACGASATAPAPPCGCRGGPSRRSGPTPTPTSTTAASTWSTPSARKTAASPSSRCTPSPTRKTRGGATPRRVVRGRARLRLGCGDRFWGVDGPVQARAVCAEIEWTAWPAHHPCYQRVLAAIHKQYRECQLLPIRPEERPIIAVEHQRIGLVHRIVDHLPRAQDVATNHGWEMI